MQEDIESHKYAPPPLSIDELGWDKFLTLWKNESTELVRGWVFKHGFGNGSEEYIKLVESQLDVVVPRELYFGGLTYPGRNLKEKKHIDCILKQIEILIDASAEYAKKMDYKVFIGNPDYYLYYLQTNLEAYTYSALLNRQKQAPATEDEIAQVEKKLNVHLPPSYKAFLLASNGYWANDLTCLMPVQNIGLATKLKPETFSYYRAESSINYSDYYKYNNNGRTYGDDAGLDGGLFQVDSKLFNQALLLSVPQITGSEETDIGIIPYASGYSDATKSMGEWESFISTYFLRAKSFKHLMEYLYQFNISIQRSYLENGRFF